MNSPNPEIRIAQLCLSRAAGGLERSVLTGVLEFQKRGYHSTCICPSDSFLETALQPRLASGIKMVAVPAQHKYVDWTSTRRIRKFLKEERINRVVVHSLRDIWILYPALMGLPHIKLVGFCRMFVRNVNKKDLLHRILYRRFDHVVALGENQKGELLKCLPVVESKYEVIPNPVDVERFAPRPRNEELRREWGMSEGDLVFGFVGRLDRQKGLVELLKAFGEVRAQIRPKLVVVGEENVGETGFRRELEALITELQLGDQVRMIPAREDIPAVMNAFDVFVMPSYEEAFGKVLIEAMASGLPCIATNAGGPPEILQAGKVGLLVEPKSSHSLAEAIVKLAQNSELRQSFARLGRETAVEHFEVDRVFSRIENLVVGARTARSSSAEEPRRPRY